MTESRRSGLFQPGDLLNNTYRIETILGQGGTSEVYRARNEVSKRLVAIKALKFEFSGNEDYLTLMTREEEIRDIRHDAVVRYSENHRTRDGHIYLVMDYVEGPALDSIMRDGGMSADDLLKVVKRVAQGLQVAHGRSIVHRDLSPDNIILRGGEPSEAVIIDFGIAKDTNPGAATIVGNEFAGKYGYAAPEQLGGNSDARSDLYSLGALILATYRGKKPEMGANPLEVVQNKAKPLDTLDVPEPLKSLIDRMSDPDPDKRFQSAAELLAALEPRSDDATIIVPRQAAAADPGEPKVEIIVQKPKPATAETPAKSGRGGLIALLAVIVLGGAGAGAYFGGFLDSFLGPVLPVADPYSLVVEKPDQGIPRAVGFVPSEAVLAAISSDIRRLGGTVNLSLATGAIADSWGDDVIAAIAAAAPLDSWRLVVNGNDAKVTGVANDRAVRASVRDRFGAGLPGALQGSATIALGPIVLTAAMLQPVLEKFADCGPLSLVSPPQVGYGTDATITVGGLLAETETRVALFDALSAVSGDRTVVMNAEVLNPALCQIEASLPNAPTSGIAIRMGFGDRPDENTSGRYFVGENPVIDLVLPADMSGGFLSVSILDVSGNVFHLLPNLNRPDNSVATLRQDTAGAVPVRVAFGLDEVTDASQLAFTVDGSSLGKSKVVVIHSEEPLFADPRPTTESVAGYAQALQTLAAARTVTIHSLDSRILTTAEP